MSEDRRWVPTICRNCVNGPDPVRVLTVNGVAVNIEGNASGPGFAQFSKVQGRVCPKAFGMIQKLYDPNRIKGPLKRTNPEKGRGIDPKFVEISWDEALGIVAEKFGKIRATDARRLSVGDAGQSRLTQNGTWDAFFQAFGPVQYLNSGGGARCHMAEHVFGNLIHGGFHCEADLSYCNYMILMGSNPAASGGAPESVLHADARTRGMKTVVVDPVFSFTAAKGDQWIPIKPGTDLAFLLAMVHIIIYELGHYDVPYLKKLTNSPYLVGTDGYFVRDGRGKILIWDAVAGKPKPYDAADIQDLALEGTYSVEGREVRPAFQILKEHVAEYTAEWSAGITDVSARKIRQITQEYLQAAQVGSTIQLDGLTLPLRPVAIKIGRGVTGQARSYQCSLAQHVLAILVGGLEVPGGHGGGRTTPGITNLDGIGITDGPDGMAGLDTYPFIWPPKSYGGAETLFPYGKIYHSVDARHLAYRNLKNPPPNFPLPPPPEAYFRYRCNPLTTVGEPDLVYEVLARIPFFVSVSYLRDDVTQLADIVLPEHLDLERFDFTRCMRNVAAKKFLGSLLRQPVVKPVHNTMEISDIFTDLAGRMGFLDEYNAAINTRFGFSGPHRLEAGEKYTWPEIVDRLCRSATKNQHDLQWFQENGGCLEPVPVTYQYDVHPQMVARKVRYYLPYMEHVKKTGEDLSRNLARVRVDWWPTDDYTALPTYFPSAMEEVPKEYDFYVTTCRIAQLSYGTYAECPWLSEAADLIPGQTDVIMNSKAAKSRGIANGDQVWVESDVGKVKRKVKLTEGIRPDTILIAGQFGQRATPGEKETGRVTQTALVPLRHRWTDQIVCSMQGNTVKGRIYKAEE